LFPTATPDFRPGANECRRYAAGIGPLDRTDAPTNLDLKHILKRCATQNQSFFRSLLGSTRNPQLRMFSHKAPVRWQMLDFGVFLRL